MVDSTFSLIARDPGNGAIGLAVSTASLAVGKRVPHLLNGVGLVATQGRTNVRYGTMGLRLLEIGFSPQETLDTLVRLDTHSQYRQVLIARLRGDWAVHTGDLTEPWHGHLVTERYVAMGNTLTGPQVLEAMANGFEAASGDLAFRLMAGLRRGQGKGGDREGRKSAALVVTSPQQFEPWGALVDLRVDLDPDPVERLQELLERYVVWEAQKLREVDKGIYGFRAEQA